MPGILSFVLLALVMIKNSKEEAFLFQPSSVMLQPGATLMNYIYFNTSNAKATQCFVSFLNAENEMENISLSLASHAKIEKNDVTSRISPLYRNTCGFTLIKYQEKTDAKQFSLWIRYDENGEEHAKSFNFSARIFDNSKTDANKTLIVELGQEVLIECKNQKGAVCTLANPSGEIIQSARSCTWKIKHVTMRDIGIWICQFGYMQNMASDKEHVTLKLFDDWKMITWYNESNGYGNVGCHFVNVITGSNILPPDYCQFIRPDGAIYTISARAGATERYTSLGMNLTEFTCQIEFPLPAAAHEIGSWKFLIGETGGFALVKKNEVARQPQKLRLLVTLTSEATIACNVQYNSDDCYLTSPNGTIFGGGTELSFSLGRCGLLVKSIQETDLGDWTCHFSQPDAPLDEVIVVEVMLYDDLQTLTSHVEIDEGDDLELMCTAPSAIVNCAFQAADGKTYHVSPRKNTTSTRYTYVGKRLNNGDCGIIIGNVTVEDKGRWKCLTRLHSPDPKLVAKSLSVIMYVEVITSVPITASTIGISAGVGCALVVLIAGFCIAKWRRNKQNQRNNMAGNEANANSMEMPLNSVARSIHINEESSAAHI